MTVEQVRAAADKALEGKKLGVREARAVGAMLDTIGVEREGRIDYVREELAKARKERGALLQGFPPISVYEDTAAGEIFEEDAYEPDWDGPTRSLAELAYEAEQVDPEAVAALKDSLEPDDAARALAEIIARQHEQETAEPAPTGELETGEGAAPAQPEGEVPAEISGADKEVVVDLGDGVTETTTVAVGGSGRVYRKVVTRHPDGKEYGGTEYILNAEGEFIAPEEANFLSPDSAERPHQGSREDSERIRNLLLERAKTEDRAELKRIDDEIARIAQGLPEAEAPAEAAPEAEGVAPEQETVFAEMRKLGDEALRLNEEHRKLLPPPGQVSVGGAAIDPLIRAEGLQSLLQAIRDGKSIADALAAAKETAALFVSKHNERADFVTRRADDSGASYLEDKARALARTLGVDFNTPLLEAEDAIQLQPVPGVRGEGEPGGERPEGLAPTLPGGEEAQGQEEVETPEGRPRIRVSLIPADATVTRKALVEETGQEVTITQNAREAVRELDKQRSIYQKLMDCVSA
jgi:hypothetical protein